MINPDNDPPDFYVEVSEAPASASAMPTPTKVDPPHMCGGDDDLDCPTGFAMLPDGQMGILFSDRCTQSPGVAAIYLAVGKPGQTFTKTLIAGGDRTCAYGNAMMAQDHATGELVVVDYWWDVAGGGYYAWTQQPGEPWIGPVKIASTDMSASAVNPTLQLSTLVADSGEVWVGLDRSHYRGDRTGRPADDGAFLVHRSATGTWDAMIQVPGSDRYAVHPVLATNQGTLSVLYARQDRFDPIGGSGLRYLTRAADGTWSATTALTRWFQDDPVTVIPSADPLVFAYLRY